MGAKTIQTAMISDVTLGPPPRTFPGQAAPGAAVSRALPPYFLRLFFSGIPANELTDTWRFILALLALALFL